jgi:hypothetical protein
MTRLARRPDALWRRTAEGVVVLGAGSADVRAVNGPAAALWDLLAAPTELSDAVDSLAASFGADREVVAGDVEDVLATWLADGAIERVP